MVNKKMDSYNIKHQNNDIDMETNKIFCFNGKFTILAVSILVLILLYININSKK